VILIATGSAVSNAVDAQTQLEGEGIPARVVSAPGLEWYVAQGEEYRESVVTNRVRARVAGGAGVQATWHKYVVNARRKTFIEEYGASADAGTMCEKFRFTASAVVEAAKASISPEN